MQDNAFTHLCYKRIDVCMGVTSNKFRIVISLGDICGIESGMEDRRNIHIIFLSLILMDM